MIKTIHVKDIKTNPFQHRSVINQETILQLADEIKSVGLWTGALRGRSDGNGSIELCSGHRRLEAVKKLGWKTVDIDVLDLNDEQMLEQSLIENLQREGLNDADKADGIHRLIEVLKKNAKLHDVAPTTQVAELLGFSTGQIRRWLQLAEFKEPEKQLVRKGNISGAGAVAAHQIGGPGMVRMAAAEKLTQKTIEQIGATLNAISSAPIKAKVKEAVIAGKVTTPEKIQQKARQLEVKPKEAPPDLIIVVQQWTGFIQKWTSELSAVQPYIEYIDKAPSIAKKFRDAVRGLIQTLEKFL